MSTFIAPSLSLPAPHLLADVQHGSLVALALADHDGAFNADGVQRGAHAFHRRVVCAIGVTHPHGASGGDRRLLHHSQHFQ
jgi:hypothetical protein